MASTDLPELLHLQAILATAPSQVQSRVIAQVGPEQWPIYHVYFTPQQPQKPSLLLTAGFHGLERIGSQVLLAYLESLCQRLSWDEQFQQLLSHVNLHIVPIVNPSGIARGWRSNAEHIDLMRNAPHDSLEGAAFLVGGHRISGRLPWYRGPHGAWAAENRAIALLLQEWLWPSPISLVLDCHSGFGQTDRIWFPYAKSRQQPIAHLAHMYRIRQLFFQTYPHQNYLFEPQSCHYLCHGDVWDHWYDQAVQHGAQLLPLTLEMGSWNWVRKNPFQLLRSHGLFHPVKPHRVKRVLRSHLILFDFLLHLTAASERGIPGLSSQHLSAARALWYPTSY